MTLPTTTELHEEGNDLVVVRYFKASPNLVYEAWIDPAKMAKWWGPKSMSASSSIRGEAGANYELIMYDDHGNPFPVKGEVLEAVANTHLVLLMRTDAQPADWHAEVDRAFLEAGGVGQASRQIITTVTFEAVPGGTRMAARQSLPTEADRKAFIALGTLQGWRESFEKLDAVLAA